MEKDATDYLIEELRKTNLPFPRATIETHRLEEIESELKQIEDSIKAYRNLLKSFKAE